MCNVNDRHRGNGTLVDPVPCLCPTGLDCTHLSRQYPSGSCLSVQARDCLVVCLPGVTTRIHSPLLHKPLASFWSPPLFPVMATLYLLHQAVQGRRPMEGGDAVTWERGVCVVTCVPFPWVRGLGSSPGNWHVSQKHLRTPLQPVKQGWDGSPGELFLFHVILLHHGVIIRIRSKY